MSLSKDEIINPAGELRLISEKTGERLADIRGKDIREMSGDISSIGDISGDGIPELLLTASNSTVDGKNNVGSLHFISTDCSTYEPVPLEFKFKTKVKKKGSLLLRLQYNSQESCKLTIRGGNNRSNLNHLLFARNISGDKMQIESKVLNAPKLTNKRGNKLKYYIQGHLDCQTKSASSPIARLAVKKIPRGDKILPSSKWFKHLRKKLR